MPGVKEEAVEMSAPTLPLVSMLKVMLCCMLCGGITASGRIEVMWFSVFASRSHFCGCVLAVSSI